MKLTEAELRNKIGKREPLPGGDKQLSPQFIGKSPTKDVPLRKVAEDQRPGIDPQVTVDPKRATGLRMGKEDLAKGGMVKPNPFGSQKAPPFGKKPAAMKAKKAPPFKGFKK